MWLQLCIAMRWKWMAFAESMVKNCDRENKNWEREKQGQELFAFCQSRSFSVGRAANLLSALFAKVQWETMNSCWTCHLWLLQLVLSYSIVNWYLLAFGLCYFGNPNRLSTLSQIANPCYSTIEVKASSLELCCLLPKEVSKIQHWSGIGQKTSMHW